MEIIPAIDLQDGRCVRLYQGDFAQSTVYADDPVAVARRWQAEGAKRIHVVDLDGARHGRPTNRPAIQAIVRGVTIPVQLGGGLRSREDVQTTLDLGVERVILGTAAVEQANLVADLVVAFGPHIVVGVDARDGKVATAGWLTTAAVRAVDLINHMAELGVQRIIYTDISRDGTLTEPNYSAMAELIRPGGPAIIASGGVAALSHLQHLATLGVEGAIVGKALYAGKFSLTEAIAALE
ncbi:MAG: 1-(5-phosphoribosyl)-5-[(5-phosphoribosylamino)methylideneamino]imidazole-4-carboxamide isomerase [Candidatus Viridilinea halotolerans]|uniref:1-(5-phosphoribosyl)-5-[(5-phosphoribosylamino)methylideneamino] imidazole-4-carboxamide isomerase n=1 Tax=Candidatus Viridilinea halotolerans TaxID=2491704 RepID=A0A426TQH6_9CHLR|nr:MAG: 1-(5-phosphoribosyl)-5-[(5-phosphoribosylamino)methylideneamino]imidazole-4-carboxamide isomerase [Candidatus Viridilinea halotolerans]